MPTEPLHGSDAVIVPRRLWDAQQQQITDLTAKLRQYEQQSGGFTQEKLQQIAEHTRSLLVDLLHFVRAPNSTDVPRLTSHISSVIQWYDTQVVARGPFSAPEAWPHEDDDTPQGMGQALPFGLP